MNSDGSRSQVTARVTLVAGLICIVTLFLCISQKKSPFYATLVPGHKKGIVVLFMYIGFNVSLGWCIEILFTPKVMYCLDALLPALT